MTRVEERGSPVIVGDAEREALTRYFRGEPGVVAAYLFGSQARREAGPLSDVDLGVWLAPSLDRRRRWDRRLALLRGACEVLGTSEVQLVVLNDAPPLLRHRVLRDGVRLADLDPPRRVAFETRAMLDYLDTIPLRAELGRMLARRVADGTYGRPRGG